MTEQAAHECASSKTEWHVNWKTILFGGIISLGWVFTLSTGSTHTPLVSTRPDARDWNCIRYNFGHRSSERGTGAPEDNCLQHDHSWCNTAWSFWMSRNEWLRHLTYDFFRFVT